MSAGVWGGGGVQGGDSVLKMGASWGGSTFPRDRQGIRTRRASLVPALRDQYLLAPSDGGEGSSPSLTFKSLKSKK